MCLLTHKSRAVRMKKHGYETNFSKINFSSNIGGIESDESVNVKLF